MIGLCSQIYAHNKNLEKADGEPKPINVEEEEKTERRKKMMNNLDKNA